MRGKSSLLPSTSHPVHVVSARVLALQTQGPGKDHAGGRVHMNINLVISVLVRWSQVDGCPKLHQQPTYPVLGLQTSKGPRLKN